MLIYRQSLPGEPSPEPADDARLLKITGNEQYRTKRVLDADVPHSHGGMERLRGESAESLIPNMRILTGLFCSRRLDISSAWRQTRLCITPRHLDDDTEESPMIWTILFRGYYYGRRDSWTRIGYFISL